MWGANIPNVTKNYLNDFTALGYYYRIISTTATKGLLTRSRSSEYYLSTIAISMIEDLCCYYFYSIGRDRSMILFLDRLQSIIHAAQL